MESDDIAQSAADRWNAGADKYNQWDALGQDEKNDLIAAEQMRTASPAAHDDNGNAIRKPHPEGRQTMGVEANHFVTASNERVLTDGGQQGMRGKVGVGSTSERNQGNVAAAIFGNCAGLDNRQLDEIIEWVRLYKK